MNNFKTTTKKEQIIHNGIEETKQKCIPYIIDNRYLKRERLLLPSAFIFIVTLRKVLCLSTFKMYVIKNQMKTFFNRFRYKYHNRLLYIGFWILTER
jgi:hypothetical protein